MTFVNVGTYVLLGKSMIISIFKNFYTEGAAENHNCILLKKKKKTTLKHFTANLYLTLEDLFSIQSMQKNYQNTAMQHPFKIQWKRVNKNFSDLSRNCWIRIIRKSEFIGRYLITTWLEFDVIYSWNRWLYSKPFPNLMRSTN